MSETYYIGRRVDKKTGEIEMVHIPSYGPILFYKPSSAKAFVRGCFGTSRKHRTEVVKVRLVEDTQ